jgi:methionyl aminopeptidase
VVVKLKTPAQIKTMHEAGRIVAEIHALLRERVRPGVSTADLDTFVERELRKRGATPSFKGYGRPPFPAAICTAINEQVVHGIPSPRQILREGDIIGIDIGAYYKGFHGDACVTYPVGRISREAERLLRVTEECLWLGIEQAREGKRIGDIGHAIQTHAEGAGYGVVRTLVGHGLGQRLHEEPSVSHVGEAGKGPLIRRGMVFTIEPMINEGTPDWHVLADGWTVVTDDRKLSAQFEHAVAITEHGTEILTQLT